MNLKSNFIRYETDRQLCTERNPLFKGDTHKVKPEWKNRCLGLALNHFSKEQKKKDTFFFKCGKILRNVKSEKGYLKVNEIFYFYCLNISMIKFFLSNWREKSGGKK